jgi:hypothetical protein
MRLSFFGRHPEVSYAASIFLLFVHVTSLGCSRRTEPALPDAATELHSIVAADPARYPSLHEVKHWSNPYLVIRAASRSSGFRLLEARNPARDK